MSSEKQKPFKGEEYDLLISMDEVNLYNMEKICGDAAAGKLSLLRDVQVGCSGLLARLTEEH